MPYNISDTSPHITAKTNVGTFRKIVSYLVILTLSFSPMAAYPSNGAATHEQEYMAAVDRLDDFMSMLSQLRTYID